jgi:hypothetical protein
MPRTQSKTSAVKQGTTRRRSSIITPPTATLRPPNIITCMNDPALFAPYFPGESWDGWRTVLKATRWLRQGAQRRAQGDRSGQGNAQA